MTVCYGEGGGKTLPSQGFYKNNYFTFPRFPSSIIHVTLVIQPLIIKEGIAGSNGSQHRLGF